MKQTLILLLRMYQKVFSPDQGLFRVLFRSTKREGGGHCNMYPTCSEYMISAIEKYGVTKGVFKGIRRILRCHPFQKKLVDLP